MDVSVASAAVSVRGLRKRYGDAVVVDGISFEVAPGEIFGIVGPNGAGKTTTLECIEGLRRQDEGEVRVLGLDPHADGTRLLPLIGVQLQQASLQEHLKVREAIDLFASFYPDPLEGQAVLQRVGLSGKEGAEFRTLSGGEKQRLFIALALVGNPKLLFLDELTTGLDPHARRAMWDEIRAIRDEGRTIILTTHFMEEAERLCDRVAIIDTGRIVALDTPAALVERFGGGGRVRFRLAGEAGAGSADGDATTQGVSGVIAALSALPGVERVEPDHEWVTVSGTGPRLLFQVVHALDEGGVGVQELRSEQPTLDDVFIRLTGRRLQDGETRPAQDDTAPGAGAAGGRRAGRRGTGR